MDHATAERRRAQIMARLEALETGHAERVARLERECDDLIARLQRYGLWEGGPPIPLYNFSPAQQAEIAQLRAELRAIKHRLAQARGTDRTYVFDTGQHAPDAAVRYVGPAWPRRTTPDLPPMTSAYRMLWLIGVAVCIVWIALFFVVAHAPLAGLIGLIGLAFAGYAYDDKRSPVVRRLRQRRGGKWPEPFQTPPLSPGAPSVTPARPLTFRGYGTAATLKGWYE